MSATSSSKPPSPPLRERAPRRPKSVTTTVLPSQATQTLKDAIDQIFAQGLDDRMMAAMPDYWRLYYQAVAHRADYRPPIRPSPAKQRRP